MNHRNSEQPSSDSANTGAAPGGGQAESTGAKTGWMFQSAKYAIVAVKLAMIAVIVWLVYSTLSGFFGWSQVTDQAAIENAATPDGDLPLPLPPLLMSAFDDGAWEFAGVPWQVRMTTVKSGDIDRALQALPRADQLSSGVVSEETQKLITMLRATGAKEQQLGQLKLLQSDNLMGRVVLVLQSVSTGDELVLGRIAWPDGGDWRLIEGSPAADSARNSTSKVTQSPPVPSDADVLATRWANDGTFLGRIVAFAGPHGPLVNSWKQAGWTVERAPTQIISTDDVPLFVVEREGLCFSAHFFASSDGPTTLFLTRVPD
jgi:hypothetical protein